MAKSTTTQLRAHTKAILESIDKEKDVSRKSGQNFISTTSDDIEKRVKAATSPFLSMYGWTKEAAPGGRIELRVFVWNSESKPTPDVYVHVWVGSGNIDPVVGTFLLNVDPRFPRLTRPEPPGLVAGDPHEFPLSPGLKRLNFSLTLPSALEDSVYLGNICLMQLASYGVGRYLGRGVRSEEGRA